MRNRSLGIASHCLPSALRSVAWQNYRMCHHRSSLPIYACISAAICNSVRLKLSRRRTWQVSLWLCLSIAALKSFANSTMHLQRVILARLGPKITCFGAFTCPDSAGTYGYTWRRVNFANDEKLLVCFQQAPLSNSTFPQNHSSVLDYTFSDHFPCPVR